MVFVIAAVLVIVLVRTGTIEKLKKRIRAKRGSLRDTFGGGAVRTRADAVEMLLRSGKEKRIPRYAILDAAEVLFKYNLADSRSVAANELERNLTDQGYIVIDMPRGMTVGRHETPERAQNGIRAHLKKLNARYYLENGQLSPQDETLVENCRAAYFFAVDSAGVRDAEAAVGLLLDEWKAGVGSRSNRASGGTGAGR